MIIVIISIIFLIVVTEIFYFGYFREEFEVYKNISNFILAKIISIMISFLAWFILIVIPLISQNGGNLTYLQVFGWYYGVILSVVIFFGINLLITKHLEKKDGK